MDNQTPNSQGSKIMPEVNKAVNFMEEHAQRQSNVGYVTSPQGRQKFLLWFGLGLTCFSLLFLVFAVKNIIQTRDLVNHSIVTTGTISDLHQSVEDRTSQRRMSSGNYITEHYTVTVYYPQVTFTTADGQSATFQGKNGSENQSNYQVGQQVPVRYDPSNPSNAVINTFAETWGGLIAGTVFALIALFVGIVMLVKSRKSV